MPASRRTGNSKPPQLRHFANPPDETRQLIEAVADYVAQHGVHTEFQLRSGAEGRQEFPFLHLDNEYAPFYQVKLKDARAAQSATFAELASNVSAETREQSVTNEQARLRRGDGAAVTNNSHYEPVELPHPRNLSHNARASILVHQAKLRQYQNSRKAANMHKETLPLPSQAILHDQTNNAQDGSFQHAGAAATFPNNQSPSQSLNSPPATPPESSAHQETIPYGLLQEVHLLDSNGTERSGLTTYLVISNTHPNQQPDDPLLDQLYNSPKPVIDAEPIYRLRPDISVVFRAPHSRLLPVGLPLGAEVKQRDNILASIVVRRTVERGVRLYDVKDELGILYQNVSEDMLEPHEGGVFDFRLPH